MANKPKGNQYQPFDALKGFSKKLREVEVEIEPRRQLSEDKLEEINNKLIGLKKGDIKTFVVYDGKKTVSFKGILNGIDKYNGIIYINNLKFKFVDLYDII